MQAAPIGIARSGAGCSCIGRTPGILYTSMRSGARNPRPASGRVQSPLHPAGAAVSPRVERIDSPDSYKSRAYAALKDAIVAMDVYRSRTDIRLDERRLALDFGISR